MLFIGFIALIIGIVSLHIKWYFSIILTFTFFIFILLKRKKTYLFYSIGFYILGLGLYSATTFTYSQVDEVKSVFLVTRAKENYYLVDNYIGKFYIYDKGNPINAGDILYLEGKTSDLSFVTLESEYDFKAYLNDQGVYKQLFISKKEVILNSIFNQKEQKAKLETYVHDDSIDLLNLLFFGENNSDLRNDFNNLNIVYLLSASGFFVDLLLVLFSKHLERLMDKKYARILAYLILVPYILLNLFNYSVIRVSTLFLLSTFFKPSDESNYDRLDLIAIFGTISLILNPHLLFSISFSLGIGISIFNHLSKDYLELFSIAKRRIIKRIILYIFLIPTSIYISQRFNIFSFLIQLIMLPYMEIIYVTSFASYFFGYVPFLKYLFDGLKIISEFLSRHSVVVYFPKIPIEGFMGIMLLEFLSFYCWFIRNKEINRFLNLFLIIFALLFVIPYRSIFISSITFLNIGQGDSIFIQDRFTNILIDTGGNLYKDIATSSLIPYFIRNKIYRIDTVFVSHFDYDHYGALNSLIKNFKVKNVITGNDFTEISINNLIFKNLNYESEFGDKNEGSQVLSLYFHGDYYLFTGDAPIEIENKIMEKYKDLKCDILKVGHHGSKTSSSVKFLKFLSPREAVISVGKNNKYGHPDSEVISNLNKLGIKIRRTDFEGSICYTYF